MENFRVNSCKKEDKRGILKGQQIKTESETYDEFVSKLSALDKKNFLEILNLKNEMIADLWKVVDKLTIENDNLIELHNGIEIAESEADNTTDLFLEGSYEGYDLDEYAKAYEEANKVII
jgi:hypothetical protein